jgi:chromate reductase
MASKKIAVLVGSLRKESWNRKMANALIKLAPKGFDYELVEIGGLPLYNEDLDHENPPKEWTEFRNRLRDVQGVLFVTPEYNRSVPGAMKNAIDVGSRPYGKSVFDHKPAGIVTVSPGAMGGFGANHHLRQSLVFLNMPTLQQPEAYVGNASKIFEPDGSLVESTRTFMEKFINAFDQWVSKHSPD